MAKPLDNFTDSIELAGPLRLVINEFRSASRQIMQWYADDGAMAADGIQGAAELACGWIRIYAVCCSDGEIRTATQLILSETRFRTESLTKPACPHARAAHPQEPR